MRIPRLDLTYASPATLRNTSFNSQSRQRVGSEWAAIPERIGLLSGSPSLFERAISPERWRFGLEAMERPISERQCDIGADRGANKAWCWANFDRDSESPIILFRRVNSMGRAT